MIYIEISSKDSFIGIYFCLVEKSIWSSTILYQNLFESRFFSRTPSPSALVSWYSEISISEHLS